MGPFNNMPKKLNEKEEIHLSTSVTHILHLFSIFLKGHSSNNCSSIQSVIICLYYDLILIFAFMIG